MRHGVVLFLAVFCAGSLAYANDIEVIIGGKSYDSMALYRAAKRDPAPSKEAMPEKLDPQTEKAVKELKSVSSEQSVGRVKADFDQNWDNPTPKFKIEAAELEQRLEALADNRKEPVLVVSENGKLRVMLLDESKKSPETATK